MHHEQVQNALNDDLAYVATEHSVPDGCISIILRTDGQGDVELNVFRNQAVKSSVSEALLSGIPLTY